MSDPNEHFGTVSTVPDETDRQATLSDTDLLMMSVHFFTRTLHVPIQPDWGITRYGACQCSAGAACARAGKHPSVRKPRDRATTDLGQIEQWVRMGRNLAAVPVNYIVLDVEYKTGHDGIRPLRQWCEMAGLDPADLFSTFTVRSGGGGLHLWFWLPESCDPPRGMDGWLPDVDVKTSVKVSDKATIPGSRHVSGGRYEFVLNGLGGAGFNEPRRAPSVLVDEIRAGRAWRPLSPVEWPAFGAVGGSVLFGEFVEQTLPWRRAELLPPGAARPSRSAYDGLPLGSLDGGLTQWAREVSPR